MTLAELKTCIISKNIPNLMIFTGEEWYVLKIYLAQVMHCLEDQCNCVRCKSVSDIFNYNTKGLFTSKHNLFIVMDDNDFVKTEQSWNNLKNVLKSNKVILCYHDYDLRLGFWKKFKQETVVFDKLKQDILIKHLNQNTALSDECYHELAAGCDNSLGRCELELDKLVNLAQVRGELLSSEFFTKYKQVLSLDAYQTVFDWLKSIAVKDWKNSLSLYQILKNKQEPVVKLINLLYNTFKNILIVQTIKYSKNIQQSTGLNYYSYRKAQELAGHFSNLELEYLMYKLMTLEQGIKTGRVEADLALDIFFTYMCED